jgi:hypothetical protein
MAVLVAVQPEQLDQVLRHMDLEILHHFHLRKETMVAQEIKAPTNGQVAVEVE